VRIYTTTPAAVFDKAIELDPKDDYTTYGKGLSLVGLAAEKHSFVDLNLTLQSFTHSLAINLAYKDAHRAIVLITQFFKYIHDVGLK